MPTQYDPKVLQKFADDLYSRARSIVISSCLIYGLLGYLVPWAAFSFIPRTGDSSTALANLTWFICIFAALIGFAIGRQKAFKLKLQAQQILCQMQIEANTRQSYATASAGHN